MPSSMEENKQYYFVRPDNLSKVNINLTTPKGTVEMKDNMSYGPVRVQSQTATQEPVYEEANIL